MTASTDTIVSLRAIFTVPEGKLEEFKSGFAKFYENTSAGTAKTGSCLYYGFAINENTVICREAYKTAKDVLNHIGEVKQEITEAVDMIGNENFRLEVFGPEAELEKLKEPLAPFKKDLYVLDQGSMTFFKAIDQAEVEDNHVAIVPFFTIPDGKMVDFQKNFGAFYEQTKAGTGASGECFYYGFAVCGNKVFCREGYKNAKACLNHLKEVNEQLKVATDLVGEGGLELSVIGPKSELDALKGALGPLGTKFFELENGGLATFLLN